ncbi:MAG: hypothetical protein LBR17_06335 [Bacteroidales bacterium]|jgi:hypothetical protein|nr:hypothetical protein [Bacteroidales bacterium]
MKTVLNCILVAFCANVMTSCGNDNELVGTQWYAKVVQIYPYGDSTKVYTYLDEFNFTSESDYTYSWQEKVELYKADTLVNEQNNAAQYYSDTYTFNDDEGKMQMYGNEYNFSVTDNVLLFKQGNTIIRFGKGSVMRNDTMYMY